MDIEDFAARLDPKNAYRKDLLQTVGLSVRDMGTELRPRDSKLFETVIDLTNRKLFPIVDRLTNTVFGTTSHGLLRTELYRYQYYGDGTKTDFVDSETSADRYTTEGHGWFISSMQPGVIIAAKAYRPDHLDKDLFKLFEVEETERFSAAELGRFMRSRDL